jgi:hypothetical protein
VPYKCSKVHHGERDDLRSQSIVHQRGRVNKRLLCALHVRFWTVASGNRRRFVLPKTLRRARISVSFEKQSVQLQRTLVAGLFCDRPTQCSLSLSMAPRLFFHSHLLPVAVSAWCAAYFDPCLTDRS